MATATAATWVFAMLLLAAGVGKLARPAPTRAALRRAHLPGGAPLVRSIGGGEVIIGGLVLLPGGAASAADRSRLRVLRHRQRAGHRGARRHRLGGGHRAGRRRRARTHAVDVLAARPWYGVLALSLAATAAGALRLLLTAAPDVTAAITLVDPDGTT